MFFDRAKAQREGVFLFLSRLDSAGPLWTGPLANLRTALQCGAGVEQTAVEFAGVLGQVAQALTAAQAEKNALLQESLQFKAQAQYYRQLAENTAASFNSAEVQRLQNQVQALRAELSRAQLSIGRQQAELTATYQSLADEKAKLADANRLIARQHQDLVDGWGAES